MTYAVLAAGAARRMGFAKVFTALPSGKAPLEGIATLLHARKAVVVVPSARVDDARRMAPAMRVVTNDETERGMTHSLRLALSAIEKDEDFGVVLGDKPFLRAETLERLEKCLDGFDVAYPVDAAGMPGHPVLFSRRARAIVEALPDGDTLFQARDDAMLRRHAFEVDDKGAFTDLNTREQWLGEDA